MSDEWIWAAIIVAVPLVIFGLAEAVSFVRRRRLQALARRPKHPRPRPPGPRPGQAG